MVIYDVVQQWKNQKTKEVRAEALLSEKQFQTNKERGIAQHSFLYYDQASQPYFDHGYLPSPVRKGIATLSRLLTGFAG
jgi:activator of HSP90 ATPase